MRNTPPSDPVWIVDDDRDDHELITEIFSDLDHPHPLQFFRNATQMLKALDESDSAPFIIICEVNLPGMDGFALRQKLLETPDNKFHSVPFIFWSTSATKHQIKKAYELRAHGFFIKEAKYEDWKDSFIQIIQYWEKSQKPSKEEKPEAPLI